MRNFKGWVLAAYILQLIGFFTILGFLIAIFISYGNRDETRGSYLSSHVEWQISTFWSGLMWWLIGILTLVIGIGAVILFLTWIWVLYRTIKGLVVFSRDEPIYK